MKTKMKAAKTKGKTVKALRQTERVGPRGAEKRKGKGPEMLTEGNKGNEGMEDGAGLAIKWVLRKEIRPDVEQPRKNFEKGKLEELAASIKAVGIRAPLQVERHEGYLVRLCEDRELGYEVVDRRSRAVARMEFRENIAHRVAEELGGEKPFYKLVDGERRWRAAELAGVERVPVMVVDTSAPDWEKKKLAIQVVLNQQHENLSALEEAAAYGKEIESGRHTAESLWKAVGISRSSLFGRLALLRLEAEGKEALLAGRISTSVAALLVAVRKEELGNAIRRVEGQSFRDAQRIVEEHFARQLKDAAFDQEAAYALAPGMVEDAEPEHKGLSLGCKGCGYRSGNLEGVGLKNPNVCTLPVCFEGKTKAAAEIKLAAAREKGCEVLAPKEAQGLFNNYGQNELRYDAPYVDLAEGCEPLGYGTKKTWRTALGEHCPPVKVVVDPAGAVRELVKEDAAKEGLRKAGHKLERTSGSDGNAQWKREQKVRAEKKALYRRAAERATATILEKLVPGEKGPVEKVWREMALGAFHTTSIDVHDFVAKRMGIAKTQGEARENLEKYIETTVSWWTLAGVTLEMLVCAQFNEGWNDPKWSERFEVVAKMAGVNLATLLEEEKEAKKEKLQGKITKVTKEYEHRWRKTDLVSGALTNYACEKCKVKGVRYGVQWPPKAKGKAKGKCKVEGPGNETLGK